MKRLLPLIICFSFLAVCGQAPAIQWDKTIGSANSNGDAGYDIQATTDGGFIVAGYASGNGATITGFHGLRDFLVVKFDADGNTQWQKCFGGTGNDLAFAVTQVSDGYLIGGQTNLNSGDVTGVHGGIDVWIVKIDNSGDLVWQKTFGGSDQDALQSMVSTADGGAIFASYSFSLDGDRLSATLDKDLWVVKISSSGAIEWENSYPTSNPWIYITAVPTGGYAIAHSIAGNYKLLKITQTGAVEWEKTYGGSEQDWAFAIDNTPDGGYVLGGESYSDDGDVTGHHGAAGDWGDAWVVKTDASGNLQWQKSLGSTAVDQVYDIKALPDGGILVLAITGVNNGDVVGVHSAGYLDYWLIRLSPTGALLWQKCLGGTDSETAYGLTLSADGGCAVSGRAWSNNGDVTTSYGSGDCWVVKLGPIALGVDENEWTPSLVSPNPVTDSFSVDSRRPVDAIAIFDVMGRNVYSSKNPTGNIDISHLAKGAYLVKLTSGNKSQTARILKK